MRKLFYYFTPSCWFGIGLVVIMILVLILSGCAGISLKAPTTQMFLQNTTYLAGFEIGKGIPALAKEIIHYTQVGRADILVLYPSWKRYLAYRLKDPVHRRLIGSMLGLVEIRLQYKTNEKQKEIIRQLFREFIVGLKEGINAH